MNDQLGDRIAQVLTAKAANAGSGEELPAVALRRGRRLVVRNRITAGLACLAAAAVAVGVPVGLGTIGGNGAGGLAPAGSIYGPAVRPVLPAGSSKISLDVDKLEQGEPPAVPYYYAGKIHDGEREIKVPLDFAGDVVIFTPVHNGYLVQTTSGDSDKEQMPHEVMLLDAAGNKVRDLPVINSRAPRALPAVSADGRSIAWPEWDADGSQHKLVVADSSTGEVRHSKVIAGTQFPYPVGFAGQRVVFAAGRLDEGYAPDAPDEHKKAVEESLRKPGAGVTGIWDPESDEVTLIGGAGTAAGTDDFEHILSTVGRCPAGYDANSKKRLWKTCGVGEAEISRAGLVFGEEDAHSVDTARSVVLDAVTGRKLLEFDEGYELVWEGGDNLVFVAWSKRGPVLVRCALDGRCERATGFLTGPAVHLTRLPDRP